MHAPWGHKEREEKKKSCTATKGEVSVGRWLWGRCSPVAGLCNINVSQFELTWERRLLIIELRTLETHSASLNVTLLTWEIKVWIQSRHTGGDASRLLMPGWQLSVEHGSMLTRNEQTSANEQTTTPWSISETNDHNNMKTNIIADRWLVFTVCYKTSPLKVKASAIMHILCLCYAPKTMTIFFVGNTCSERQNALINNSPFSFCCVLSAYTVQKQVTAAAGSLHYVFG